jgi:DNA-directed RNA polymerase subunit M/transcription elongation factor TFIIS
LRIIPAFQIKTERQVPPVHAEADRATTPCEACGREAAHLATLRALSDLPMVAVYKCAHCTTITTVPPVKG